MGILAYLWPCKHKDMIRVTVNGEKMFRCVKCDYATRQMHRAEPVTIYPLAHERMKAKRAPAKVESIKRAQ